MTPVRVRELNGDDAEPFLALRQRALTTDPDSFVDAVNDDTQHVPSQVRERLAAASVGAGDLIVGAFAPDLVGVTALTRDRRAKRRHKAYVHGMYVTPEHRGRGLGRAMLRQVLELAGRMPALEEVHLIVAAHNQAAVALYRGFGFLPVWTERRALKIGERYVDAHHMVLNLTGVV